MKSTNPGGTPWFKRQRILNKILFIYVPLVFIPLLLLSYFSYTVNTDAVIKKTKKNMLDESRLITTRIDTIMSNAESFSNMIMLDLNKEELLKTLEKQPRQDGEWQTSDYVLRSQVENKLDFARLIFQDVESAIFMDKNGHLYVTDPDLLQGSAEGVKSDMLKTVAGSNGILNWFPMQRRAYWTKDADKPVLTVGKKIMDTETLETLGYLLVNISEKALSSVYRPVGPVQSSGYSIVDNEGTIVSSADEARVLQPMGEEKKADILSGKMLAEEAVDGDGDKILLTSMPFGKQNWRLVNEIPLKELTKESWQVSKIILVVSGVCLLLALIGAIVLSRAIAVPIMSLARYVSRIRDENLDRPIEVTRGDEIGILGSGLNMMLGRVNDLLSRVKEEQKAKREYELALLQDQIKPHFFYNTLDLIYVNCMTGENEEAGRTTKALADFYRAALSNGEEIISIREEVRNIESYLYIQNARYADQFDYQIHIPNELLGYAIPKLTLQPLVENAIYHGIKEKQGFGHIAVEGSKQDGILLLRVSDDGVGFPEAKLADWNDERAAGQTGKISFGLSSVDERIKLYYGERYGVRVHSESGVGTTITVEIPLKTGDLSDHV
ncbi:cache domain-containing sensor histidine kinase [Cohnella soli]|uniref:histidine kinase n=1 Tax=Cohnella soli TaxID=425005 RepID=A0ABW0I4R8_9BACL